MLAWISYANDRLNRHLDSFSVVPVGLAVLLGFFVLATVVLEDPASTLAASHIARFGA